ncbi:hypothetical protein [Thermopirellula anaerolimosa]
MSVPESQPRKRGGCLTAFLVVALLANLWGGCYELFAGARVREVFSSLPAWVVSVAGLLALANCVFTIAIWKWKKWGVYGFAASVAVMSLINTAAFGVFEPLPAGMHPTSVFLVRALQIAISLSGLVGLAILLVLLRPVWREMK